MNSFLFSFGARLLVPFGMALAYGLFFRGHNLPGGGFIAGLLVGISFVTLALSRGSKTLDAFKLLNPRALLILGWIFAIGSAVPSLVAGVDFMKGIWFGSIWMPVVGDTKWGTVVLFDMGVFFLVVGVVLRIVLGLLEEDEARQL